MHKCLIDELLVAATAESSQLVGWSSDGGHCACAAAGATAGAGSELSSTSTGDLISEDWFVRFSEYRLEDYYAVQATMDNDAARPFPTVPASTPPDYDFGEIPPDYTYGGSEV